MQLIDIINELAKKINKPTRVVIGKTIYKEFCKSFYPTSRTTINEKLEIKVVKPEDGFKVSNIMTDNGSLTVEVVEQDTIQVI